MRALGLDHASVQCADLDRSLGFYHGLLGIPVRERGDLDGGSAAAIAGVPGLRTRFADLVLGDGRVLELIETPVGGPGTAPAQHIRNVCGHLALRVDDADAAFARMRAAGCPTGSDGPVTIDEPGAWHGARAFYVQDPDGVTVELIERPRRVSSRWPRRSRVTHP